MKYLLTLSLLLASLLATAQDQPEPPQIPQGINYQAIARDDAGEILPEFTLTVVLRIKDAPVNGATVYTERYLDIMTDKFGLLHLVIGQGDPTGFALIDWTTTPLFLELTLDMGSEVVTLPTTPFQAVPYALAAGTSLDAKIWTKAGNDATYEDGNVGIGTDSPDRSLHVAGTGDQFLRVGSTSFEASDAGLELTRGSAFSATDHRIINDGGRLKFQSTFDNFTGQSGELNDNMTVTRVGNVGIGTLRPQSKLALQDPAAVGLTIHSTGTQSSYVDLLRGEGEALADWRIVNRQGSLSFRTGSGIGIGEDEGEGVMFLNSAGRLAVGNFSGAAEKIHVRGTADQRIRVESTDGPASIDLYSIGQDYRMVNESGRLRLQRSGNSFGAVDNIFDVRDDGTFRFRQNVDMDDLRIVNVADPEGPQQVVNLRTMEDYVGDFVANQLNLLPQQGFFPTRTSGITISNFRDCARRCHTLEDGGFDDWGVPSMEQLNQFVGDIDNITFNPFWTSTGVIVGSEYHRYTVNLATGEIGSADYEDEVRCRCVR